MRDLNDEVLDRPFDEELKRIVVGFAEILKPMVDTVDRHGLKKHFLRKHLKSVERFYRQIEKVDVQSEAALRCKERFEKNRDRLFTFLNTMEFPGTITMQNTQSKPLQRFGMSCQVLLRRGALRIT